MSHLNALNTELSDFTFYAAAAIQLVAMAIGHVVGLSPMQSAIMGTLVGIGLGALCSVRGISRLFPF